MGCQSHLRRTSLLSVPKEFLAFAIIYLAWVTKTSESLHFPERANAPAVLPTTGYFSTSNSFLVDTFPVSRNELSSKSWSKDGRKSAFTRANGGSLLKLRAASSMEDLLTAAESTVLPQTLKFPNSTAADNKTSIVAVTTTTNPVDGVSDATSRAVSSKFRKYTCRQTAWRSCKDEISTAKPSDSHSSTSTATSLPKLSSSSKTAEEQEIQESQVITADQIGGNRPTEMPFHFTTTKPTPPPTTTQAALRRRLRPEKSPHNYAYAPTQDPLIIAHNEHDVDPEELDEYLEGQLEFGSKVNKEGKQAEGAPSKRVHRVRQSTTTTTTTQATTAKIPKKVHYPPPEPEEESPSEPNEDLPFYKESGGVFEYPKRSNSHIRPNEVSFDKKVPNVKYAPKQKPETSKSSDEHVDGRKQSSYERETQEPPYREKKKQVNKQVAKPSRKTYAEPKIRQKPPKRDQTEGYRPRQEERSRKRNEETSDEDQVDEPPRKQHKVYNRKAEPQRNGDRDSEDYDDAGDPYTPRSSSADKDEEDKNNNAVFYYTPERRRENPYRQVDPYDRLPEKHDPDSDHFYGSPVNSAKQSSEKRPTTDTGRHHRPLQPSPVDESTRFSPPDPGPADGLPFQRQGVFSPIIPDRPPNRESDFRGFERPGPGFDDRGPHRSPNSGRQRNHNNNNNRDNNFQPPNFDHPNIGFGGGGEGDRGPFRSSFPRDFGFGPIDAFGQSQQSRDRHKEEDRQRPTYKNNDGDRFEGPEYANGPPEEFEDHRQRNHGTFQASTPRRNNFEAPAVLDPIYTRTLKQYDDERRRPHEERRRDEPEREESPSRNRQPEQHSDEEEEGPRGSGEEEPEEQRRPEPETEDKRRPAENEEEEEEDEASESNQRKKAPREEEEEEQEEEEEEAPRERERGESRKREQDEEEEEEEEEEEQPKKQERGSKKPPPKKPQQEKSGDLDEDISGIEREFGHLGGGPPLSTSFSLPVGKVHPVLG